MNREALLKKAVNEQLEQEIARVPADKEIQEQHVFSIGFQKQMKELLKRERRKWPLKQISLTVAAAICVLLVLTSLPLFGPGMDKSEDFAKGDNKTNESATEDNAPAASDDSADSDDDFAGSDGQELQSDEFVMEEERAEAKEGTGVLKLDKELYSADDVMVMTISNTLDRVIEFNSVFSLQMLDGEDWVPVEWADGAAATGFYGTLDPGQQREMEIDLSWFVFEQVQGRYRVVKDIEGTDLYVEFELRPQAD